MSLDVHIRLLQTPSRVLARELSLSVPPGQIMTLMGPSGCGKSSILAAVAGLLGEGMSFDGEVSLDGGRMDHLPCSQRRIGLLFQDDLLFAHMNVRDNLLFAVPPGSRPERMKAVDAALAHLGFADMAERNPATLSGGQRARVSLMRTLLAKPRALLLDEPFSKLDAALRAQFREFVFAHVQQYRLPTILVTHDAADVADAARVISLEGAHA
jgi:putative thiamine transport system ATP-binding protein